MKACKHSVCLFVCFGQLFQKFHNNHHHQQQQQNYCRTRKKNWLMVLKVFFFAFWRLKKNMKSIKHNDDDGKWWMKWNLWCSKISLLLYRNDIDPFWSMKNTSKLLLHNTQTHSVTHTQNNNNNDEKQKNKFIDDDDCSCCRHFLFHS